MIWDGSPIHRGRVVKEFVAQGAVADRVQLEQLPGYDAPDLNPDEGIWKHLKYVELKNVCCRSLSELRVELRRAKERLRHKKHVILGCIRQPGLVVSVFFCKLMSRWEKRPPSSKVVGGFKTHYRKGSERWPKTIVGRPRRSCKRSC